MSESTCVGHEPCPACGSRDNLSRWSDGHGYCHGCEYWEAGTLNDDDSTGYTPAARDGDTDAQRSFRLSGLVSSLPSRNIKEETCQHWGYRVGEYNGKPAQFAYYFDPETRKPIGAKVRFADKSFTFIGDFKKAPLYGQWLWSGGKMVVVTEGEIDALSVSQLQNLKWPVVSVKNGAQGAAKNIKEQMEWLDKFETIVLMFDMDEPGQKAAKECAELFDAGKVKIATLPYKDANECLQEGKGAAVISAMWNAEVYRPDGIICGDIITVQQMMEQKVSCYLTGYPKLDEMTGGLREGELTLLTAGSGIGKSTWAREIAYHLHQTYGLTIGNIFLEEGVEKTVKGYVGIDNDIPLKLLRRTPEVLTPQQWEDSLNAVIRQRMYFYDHFGSLNSDHLISKIKYLRRACACNFIILDHISIVISGQTSSSEGERRDIDILMTKLRSLIEATGVGIIGIVHLNSPEGKPHEEGGRVTLKNLRGSGALKQLSDNVYALERDQQSEAKDTSQVRVLKCREDGDTGLCDTLLYNRETGRLLVDTSFSPDNSEF